MTAKPGIKETSPNRLLKETLAACRSGFVAVTCFSLCINLLMLTVPIYLLQIFDRVLASRSSETLVYLTLIAGFALLTLAALEAVRGRVMVRLGTWLDQRLGGQVLRRSVVSALRQGHDPSVQGLRDLSTVRMFLTGPTIFPVMDAPWTPIFIGVIFLLHPIMGWLAVTGAVLLFCLAVTNELAIRKLLKRSGGASIRALRHAHAAVRNADVIEAMGMMPSLVRRWDGQNAEMLGLQARASRRSGTIKAMSRFVRLFLQLGILGIGAWLVLGDAITPGAMIAGSILLARALAPVDMAISSWRSAVAARDAYQRVKCHLAESDPGRAAMQLPSPKGDVAVEGLTFSHPNAAEPVLRNINFRLQAGESLGLVGPMAAGKTTLARLLVGNLSPEAGQVTLDGANVAQWNADDLGPYVGYLPQDVELFDGTVSENIARMGEGDPKAIVAAAQLAGVHEAILRLPHGYDSQIGEDGAVLSGGLRQRIALARALYGDPKLVVLDEPSASLDQTGTEALLRAVDVLRERHVTVIVIAHHPNVLRTVDRILFLRDGQVLGFGPRDEMIANMTRPAPASKPEKQAAGGHG